MQRILWAAAGVGTVSTLTMFWTDISYKREYLQMELEDYLIQCSAAGDALEIEEAEPVKEEIKAPAVIGIRRKKNEAAETRAQRDKRELKTNLIRMKEGSRESAATEEERREQQREILRHMDSGEQERIIREVLNEFLA